MSPLQRNSQTVLVLTISPPEPLYRRSWVSEHLQLDIGVLLFICEKFILRIFKELWSTGQASGLQSFVFSVMGLLWASNVEKSWIGSEELSAIVFKYPENTHSGLIVLVYAWYDNCFNASFLKRKSREFNICSYPWSMKGISLEKIKIQSSVNWRNRILFLTNWNWIAPLVSLPPHRPREII